MTYVCMTKVTERLGLSFKNAAELNKIIDSSLPGRPRFERHEILVGGEVCEVFLRDALACVQALFSDPDFAPYLAVAPERHYTDESKSMRMYHDVHTGHWWWATQVKGLFESVGPNILTPMPGRRS